MAVRTEERSAKASRRLRAGTVGLVALAIVPILPSSLSTLPPPPPAEAGVVPGGTRSLIASSLGLVIAPLGRLPEPPPSGLQCGLASWYHGTGKVAAHRFLRTGTRVTVSTDDDGHAVTVVINARASFPAGRVIAVTEDAFAALAPLGRGLVEVCLRW
jgi:Lytic transglycolase